MSQVRRTEKSYDRSRFESQLFKHLNEQLGSNHLRTTAYHPEANGMVERMYRQLKAAIKCYDTANWPGPEYYIPIILLGIRAAYWEDLKATLG